MTKKILKLALVAGALAVSGVTIAACSGGGGGDDDDDGATTPVLLKSNGSPANLTCNGVYTDPVGVGSNLTMNIRVVSQEPTSAPPASGTRVVQFDTATGNTTGTAVVTDASGRAQMTLDPSARYDFLLTKGDGSTHVPTFNFQELTPATASTGTVDMIVVSNAIVTVVTGVLSIPPADIVGKAQVAAAITDCDGDALQNATVEIPGPGGTGIARRCGEADHGYPCVAYFAGATPTTNATRTDASGRFAIIGATPGALTVKAFGVTSAGGASTQIGEADINVRADSISLFATHPLAAN